MKEREFAENAARRNGWIVNPDTEFTDSILEGLAANRTRLGYYLCPCRDSWDDRKKDRDILCPCAYAAEDVREYGQCFCGLFLSEKRAQDGTPVASIPERRPEEKFPE